MKLLFTLRFTAALMCIIHAKNCCQPWQGPAPPFPQFEDGFFQGNLFKDIVSKLAVMELAVITFEKKIL